MSVLDQNIAIFKYFEEISKIPHGSFHEEKIADYIESFAKEHDFKYVRDDMNNVIIYKHLPGFVRPGVELHIRQLHGLAVPQYGKVSPVLLGAHQLIDDIIGHEAAAAVHRNDLVPRLQAGLAAKGTVLHGIDHLAGQRGALGREQDQQHHEPQHKVHDRTGHHHQHPLPDRGLVQGDAGAFFRRPWNGH